MGRICANARCAAHANITSTSTSDPSPMLRGGAGGGVVTRAIHRIAPTDFAWMGHGTHLRKRPLRRPRQHPNHIDESPLPDAYWGGAGGGVELLGGAGDPQNRPYDLQVATTRATQWVAPTAIALLGHGAHLRHRPRRAS